MKQHFAVVVNIVSVLNTTMKFMHEKVYLKKSFVTQNASFRFIHLNLFLEARRNLFPFHAIRNNYEFLF